MRLLLAAAAVVCCSPAMADCIGSGSIRSCTDDSGNSYDTYDSGSFSSTYGRNTRTGSTWSQDTTRTGNSTFTSGRDADGNTWNVDTYSSGGMLMVTGRDSSGNTISKTCTSYGCF